MSLEKNFCASPWLHMRINNSGSYEYCRWMTHHDGISRNNKNSNLQNMNPLDFFQNHMSNVRQSMLEGKLPPGCNDCKLMEQHGKVSGRQKQLLKVGILSEHFEKSLLSSPFKHDFDFSNNNSGFTNRLPVDWQIDLGNYCNGACVFCNPENSSSLATEFLKLGLVNEVPPASWCEDPELLQKFIHDLTQIPRLQYLHFIGGETLITPGFSKILSALVENDLAKNVTIGFTTNLTVWSDSTIELLKKFYQVNLGMSIEALTAVNDYVRYPSKQEKTKTILDKWVKLGKQQNWLMQLRITPTCLTVNDLTTVYDYAWQNQLTVESCNFLNRPECLRISVLPPDLRQVAIDQLKTWIVDHAIEHRGQVVNTRDPNMIYQALLRDAQSYLNYLCSADDESFRLKDLVIYLKKLESHRGNTVIDYLPQYEELFRSAGY